MEKEKKNIEKSVRKLQNSKEKGKERKENWLTEQKRKNGKI